ncbi:hypothetical protein [Serratia sp. Se-RSBMAAmG]|uniref:hypothetical protein n=1 Tax=Serratia sp. Se-RSBMAAmG TaxID=3043305 RepID=UPI0024AEEC00|nr:hypothetical protein [Serratia sp. Se-RSBMAAmG]MDI6977176.1 hypothetical protein [Serratia sp. Se-RSBMAAmG]
MNNKEDIGYKDKLLEEMEDALRLALRCLAPASGEAEPIFVDKMKAVDKAHAVLGKLKLVRR